MSTLIPATSTTSPHRRSFTQRHCTPSPWPRGLSSPDAVD
uniref:Uncharacterized protein n=1 Tax=Arundo donax TaxID=35708 RepID=A0A0A9C9Z4_ARUDO